MCSRRKRFFEYQRHGRSHRTVQRHSAKHVINTHSTLHGNLHRHRQHHRHRQPLPSPKWTLILKWALPHFGLPQNVTWAPGLRKNFERSASAKNLRMRRTHFEKMHMCDVHISIDEKQIHQTHALNNMFLVDSLSVFECFSKFQVPMFVRPLQKRQKPFKKNLGSPFCALGHSDPKVGPKEPIPPCISVPTEALTSTICTRRLSEFPVVCSYCGRSCSWLIGSSSHALMFRASSKHFTVLQYLSSALCNDVFKKTYFRELQPATLCHLSAGRNVGTFSRPKIFSRIPCF